MDMIDRHMLFCDHKDCDPVADFSILPDRNIVIKNIEFAQDHVACNEADISFIVSVCPLTVDEHKKVTATLAPGCHLWIDIPDTPETDILESLPGAVEWVRTKNNVLIHCHMGISRSVTIACAVRMRILGEDPDTALRYIKWKRRQAYPNSGFMKQLWMYHLTLQQANLVIAAKMVPHIALVAEYLCSKIG